MSLNSETPLVTEASDLDPYSAYEILNTLYINDYQFVDPSLYKWLKDDVEIDNVTVTGDHGNNEDITYSYEDNGTTVEMFTLSFDAVSANNPITLTPITLGEYTAVLNDEPEPETYSFTINISDEADPINAGSYEEGAEVTYTFDSAYAEDPGISQWAQSITPDDLVYEFEPGTESSFDDSDPDNPVEIPEVPASISFTMPASDVTFELIYVPLYEVTVNDVPVGSYAEGTEVNITLDGPMDSISPNDLEYTYDSETGGLSFTMPAQSVTIYTTQPEPDPEPGQ